MRTSLVVTAGRRYKLSSLSILIGLPIVVRNKFSTSRGIRTLSVRRRGLTRRLRHDPSLPEDLIEALWDDPDKRLLPSAVTLQEKDRCGVYRIDSSHRGQPRSFLLKRHIWGPISRAVRMLWRQPTATRCAAVASMLTEHGIPTPAVRGCVVDGFGPLSHRSYLLTDFIQGETLFHAVRSGNLPKKHLTSVARQVAAIWQKLILLNTSHNDLKPENFMVDPNYKVWLIDFEKTKLHRNRAKLIQRHLDDAQRFLHIRSWRKDTKAAEVFRQELLQTSLRQWAAEKSTGHPLLREGYTDAELSSEISVVVPVTSEQWGSSALERTIDSVRDIADEILIVRLEERKLPNPQHTWVFVLHPGERATPDLVRHLPEWVLETEETDAFELPICPALHAHSACPTSCRVYRQDRCSLSLTNGKLVVTANLGKTATARFGLLASEQSKSISPSTMPRSNAA